MIIRHKPKNVTSTFLIQEEKIFPPINIGMMWFISGCFAMSLYLLMTQFSQSLVTYRVQGLLFIVIWLGISALYHIIRQPKSAEIIIGLSVLMLAGFGGTFYFTKDSWIQLINECLEQVGLFKGIYLTGIQRGDSMHMLITLIILSLGLVVIGTILTVYFNHIWMLVWGFYVYVLVALTNDVNSYVLALLVIGTVSYVYSHLVIFSKNSINGIYPVILLIIGLIGTPALLHVNDWVVTSKTVQSWHVQLDKKQKTRRFEKVSNPLPFGNLSSYKEYRTGIPIFKIQMTAPEPLYLKQFVGNQFINSNWSTLSNKEMSLSYPMNYWLKEGEFSSFTQLNDLAREADQKEKDTLTIDIENVNGNSQYRLHTYGMTSVPDKETKLLNDATITTTHFLGDREYSYSLLSHAVTNYPEQVSHVAKLKENSAHSLYLVNEANYNQFVYKQYLDIPEDIKGLLSSVTGVKEKGTHHIYYEEADKIVKTYISSAYKERTVTKQVPPEFVEQALHQTYHLNNDTEVATLSTLLYRQMGIPARYVEGYLVTPDSIETGKKKKITVTDKSAHAWVEIYQDGIGWIPKEYTPSYQGVMPEPIFDGLTYTGNQTSDQDSRGTNQKKQEEPEIVYDKDEDIHKVASRQSKEVTKIVVIVCVVALLIALVILVTVCLIRVYHAMTRKKNRDSRMMCETKLVAGKEMFHQVLRLYQLDGIYLSGGSLYEYEPLLLDTYKDKKYVRLYHKSVANLQEATYSNQDLNEKELARLTKLLTMTDYYVCGQQSLTKKMTRRMTLFFMK